MRKKWQSFFAHGFLTSRESKNMGKKQAVF